MIAAVASSDDRRGERWGRELRSSSPGDALRAGVIDSGPCLVRFSDLGGRTHRCAEVFDLRVTRRSGPFDEWRTASTFHRSRRASLLEPGQGLAASPSAEANFGGLSTSGVTNMRTQSNE
jgi:hypothetical protein